MTDKCGNLLPKRDKFGIISTILNNKTLIKRKPIYGSYTKYKQMKKTLLLLSLFFGFLLLVVLPLLLLVDANTTVAMPHYVNLDSFYSQSGWMFSPFTCLWGANTRLDKSSAISINTNKISQLSTFIPIFLSPINVRYYSTYVGNIQLDKLIKIIPYDVIYKQTSIYSKLGLNKKKYPLTSESI